MSTQVPQQLDQQMFVRMPDGRLVKVGDPFWVAADRIREGTICGLEVRTNGEIKFRVRADSHDSNERNEGKPIEKIWPKVNHVDSPAQAGGIRGCFPEPEELRKLILWGIKAGIYAPSPDQPGGINPFFLGVGQTGAEVLDDAVWTRGAVKGSGQTDTKGPGSLGNPHQLDGQAADNQTSVEAEQIPENQFGGPGSQLPGGRPKSNEEQADVNPPDGRVSKDEKVAFEAANPGEKVKKGPIDG